MNIYFYIAIVPILIITYFFVREFFKHFKQINNSKIESEKTSNPIKRDNLVSKDSTNKKEKYTSSSINPSKEIDDLDKEILDFYKEKQEEAFETFIPAQKKGFLPKLANYDGFGQHTGIIDIDSYDGLIGWAAYIFATGGDNSTSHIQRKLKINYERAFSICDELVELGIIKRTSQKEHKVMIYDLDRIKEILYKI
jgi:DNA segregation ATPase FtsK/SpoIIIE-like protein